MDSNRLLYNVVANQEERKLHSNFRWNKGQQVEGNSLE